MRFSRLLDKLFTEKHTGPVLLHFAGGIPRSAEVLVPSVRFSLDTEPSSRVGLTPDRTLASARSDHASANNLA